MFMNSAGVCAFSDDGGEEDRSGVVVSGRAVQRAEGEAAAGRGVGLPAGG